MLHQVLEFLSSFQSLVKRVLYLFQAYVRFLHTTVNHTSSRNIKDTRRVIPDSGKKERTERFWITSLYH